MISHVLMAALIGFNAATPVPALPDPITFAVVGDSISAGCTGHMEHTPDICTWAYTTAKPLKLRYAGGWAQAGATSTVMADSVYPVASDVLVVMAGTNDFHTGIGTEQHLADLDHIAATIGAPQVVLLKLPPIDYIALDGQTVVAERNVALEEHAAAMGWAFIDPWAEFRAGDLWAPGVSADGIHPNPAAEARAGQIIADTLRTVAR